MPKKQIDFPIKIQVAIMADVQNRLDAIYKKQCADLLAMPEENRHQYSYSDFLRRVIITGTKQLEETK